MPPYLQKHINLVLCLVLFPLAGICQILSPTVPQWVNDIGGVNGTSKVVAQKIDASNNVYVTGSFSGTVDFDPTTTVKNLTAKDSVDIYVAKYDGTGKLLWAYNIGGKRDDQANSLAIDGKGNIAIAGQFKSATMDADPGSGVFTLTNSGDNDMFLINLDTNGGFLWAKSIGGVGTDIANGVAIDGVGDRILVGQFQSTISVSGNTFTANGVYAGLCAKYSSTGTLLWTFTLRQNGDNGIHGVAVDANNNIVIAGALNGTVNFNPLGVVNNQTVVSNSSFIGEYTSAGQLIWVQPINGNVPGYDLTVCVDGSNNIYTTGPFTGGLNFGNTTLNASGAQDAFFARYNQSGVLTFAKDIASGNTAASRSTSQGIFLGPDNNIYVTGYFSGSANFDPSGSINLVDHGQQDLFIAKYTSQGFNWWANNAGNGAGCGNVAGLAIGLDNASNIILAGSFCSTVNFDFVGCSSSNITAQSMVSDGFIAKYVPGSTAAENNVITPPAVTSFCGSGDPGIITGTVAFGGLGSPVYQWQTSADSVNFINIPNTNTQNYDPPVTSANVYYRRSATSGSCFLPVLSNIVVFKTQTTITNNAIAPIPVTVFCQTGTPDTLRGSAATGGDGLTYNYQWQSSPDSVRFIDITDATNINYISPAINTTTYFRRSVTSGACTVPSTSNIIGVKIRPANSDTLKNNVITPPTATFFCTGGDPGNMVGTTPTGSSITISYQWQISTDNVTFTNITNATTKDYDPPIITVTTYYRRVASVGACAVPLTSNTIDIKVEPPILNNAITAPSINNFCTSGDPTLITGITPTGGNGTFTYQWQTSPDSVVFTDVAGVTTKDYDPPLLYNITYYRRTVTSGRCSLPSNIIVIIIQTPIINNTVSVPASATVCTVSGSAPSGGAGTFTYQWQSSTDSITFININGATLKDYDPPTSSVSIYYRRIASSGTCFPSVISNIIGIKVKAIIANNVLTAPAISTLCAGGSAARIAGTTPTGGNTTAYSYQWQSSTDNIAFTDIAGVITRSYTPGVLNVTTSFRRVVVSGVCLTPSTSNMITITVQPVLSNNVVTFPATTNFCVSGDAGIIAGSVPNGGSGVSVYQWQSSVDGISFANIAGATTKDYDPPLQNSTMYYQRNVTSGACSVPLTSNMVVVNVYPAVTNNLIQTPAVTHFCLAGTSATILGDIPDGGDETYNYQWQNSTSGIVFSNISNANSRDYSPPTTTTTMYYRRLVNSGPCIAMIPSNVVVITIDTLPIAKISKDTTLCIGTSVALNSSGGTSYRWSPATGLSDANVANPIAAPLVTTKYTVTVFKESCSVTASVNVNIIQVPVVNAGEDRKMIKGQSIQLNGSVTNGSIRYFWLPGTYLDNPNILNPTATPLTDITYMLTAVSANGCFTVSDKVFIKVFSGVVPPNTFTPNTDGTNDTWNIPPLSVFPNCLVNVYSRSGQLVFKSIGYPKAWDGTYDGKKLSSGTYYYTIDLKDGSKMLSGWVALIR